MSDQASPSGKGGGGRTLTLVVVALIAALVGGALAHFAGHRWHHMPFVAGFHHREMSIANVQTHVDRAIEHFASRVNATSEQQTKLSAIAKAAAADLLPVRQQFLEAHKKAIELLRQPTVDRAAIEALRAEQMARADAASKRLVQALADAADVLTPQQRAQLLDHFDRDGD